MGAPTGTGNQGRTLDRALDVLECLERARGPLRLSEIARESDLHLATTQRTVNQLVRRGYIQQDGLGYSLGPVILSLAHAFVVNDRLSTVATPILTELSASTGLTSSLFVRSGPERILVARVDGVDPLRYQFPIGRRVPLDLGGGKVLLAHDDDAELDAYLADLPDARLADGRVQTPADLRAELDRIRETGYHLAESERELGALSLTRPVPGHDGGAAAAINLVTTAETTTPEELLALLPEISRAAGAIGARI
ncbi:MULTISPECIES: IclR family transcriptional regulator [Nocardiopsidaceae]|jgi:IclR family transcriptional regulator, acetate operon repressor|uniref:IclR family transcriptional regulator n=1 Tax=Streptomonospora nanhaiensis TaxID=1323731 RepID=A0ABY6YI74_9ACTN|nr:IclR family transcriptional regulator [Streptomonospora nanhaiensis]WAE71841.1 IclR family transcriptional regulator [Streptomonospora nanhaiensis]